MKKFLGAGLILLAAVATSALASPGGRDASIDEWQHRLDLRIEQGRRSGELTPGEYRRLRSEMRDIERTERFFWSDGRLTPRERGELHARLDFLAREVAREKHDGERRYESYNYDTYQHGAYRRF